MMEAAIDGSVDQNMYDNDHGSRFIKECLKIGVGAWRSVE